MATQLALIRLLKLITLDVILTDKKSIVGQQSVTTKSRVCSSLKSELEISK